jgi:hypothetical protein
MTMKIFFLACVLIAASVLSGYAQSGESAPAGQDQKQEEQKNYIYQWIDVKGVAHITDSLGKVPKKYRDKALRLESGAGNESVAQPKTSSQADIEQQNAEAAEREADLKESWQTRMKLAHQRLDAAQARLDSLVQQRAELSLTVSGTTNPALGKHPNIEGIDKLDEQIKLAQDEVDAAKKEIEETIPDEARKAGIPPGWIRE